MMARVEAKTQQSCNEHQLSLVEGSQTPTRCPEDMTPEHNMTFETSRDGDGLLTSQISQGKQDISLVEPSIPSIPMLPSVSQAGGVEKATNPLAPKPHRPFDSKATPSLSQIKQRTSKLQDHARKDRLAKGMARGAAQNGTLSSHKSSPAHLTASRAQLLLQMATSPARNANVQQDRESNISKQALDRSIEQSYHPADGDEADSDDSDDEETDPLSMALSAYWSSRYDELPYNSLLRDSKRTEWVFFSKGIQGEAVETTLSLHQLKIENKMVHILPYPRSRQLDYYAQLCVAAQLPRLQEEAATTFLSSEELRVYRFRSFAMAILPPDRGEKEFFKKLWNIARDMLAGHGPFRHACRLWIAGEKSFSHVRCWPPTFLHATLPKMEEGATNDSDVTALTEQMCKTLDPGSWNMDRFLASLAKMSLEPKAYESSKDAMSGLVQQG